METTNKGKVKLVVDCALFCGNEVLLVKYSDTNKYDHQSGWFIPDDLVTQGEHPEDEAVRILKEQLGFETGDLALGFIESFTGGDRSWHLVFHYKKILDSKPDLTPSPDIAGMEWFNVKNLPDKKDIAHNGWAKYTILELSN
jgi:ADP-ribose pyrophosphatase YjhB (NUDIX family)